MSTLTMNVPTNSPEFLFSMPDVFVIPPEEDDVDPWCCFNADDARYIQSTQHDLALIPDPQSIQERLTYLIHESTVPPTFHRNSADQDTILPNSKRGSSVFEPDADAEAQAVGNDSDVIEVVKVSRSAPRGSPAKRSLSMTSKPIARSKTFRSRATKALNSFKSLGRSSKSAKPSAKDVFNYTPPQPPSVTSREAPRSALELESPDCTEPQVAHATLSRRSSVILSNIFHPSRSRSSADIRSQSVSTSNSTASSSQIPSSSTASTVPYSRHPSTASTPHFQFEEHNLAYDDDDEVYNVPLSDDLRPISPCMSARTTGSTASRMKRPFSRLNLQKLFSFAPHPPAPSSHPPTTSGSSPSPRLPPGSDDVASLAESNSSQEDDSDTMLPTLAHRNRMPQVVGSAPSTASSASASSASGIETPTDEMAPPVLSFTFDSDIDSVMALKISSDSVAGRVPLTMSAVRPRGAVFDDVDNDSTAGEMRLDSLHFDSLSFDPATFDLSELIGSG